MPLRRANSCRSRVTLVRQSTTVPNTSKRHALISEATVSAPGPVQCLRRASDRLKPRDPHRVAVLVAEERHQARIEYRLCRAIDQGRFGAGLHALFAALVVGVRRQVLDLELVAGLHVPSARGEGASDEKSARERAVPPQIGLVPPRRELLEGK